MKQKKIIYVATIIIIIALIFSFNFKTNYWNRDIIGRDSSVFVTIGEEMHEGKLPYRDVFDHKGPLLYLINFVGTIFSNNILLYVMELLFLILDLILLYKIAKYITKDDCISSTAMLIAIFPLTIVLQGGNFVEEWALPFILLSLYIFIKKDKNFKDYIFTGLSLGATLLLRPNMIVVWIVGYLFITIELLYRRNFKEFFRAFAFSVLGLTIIILPFIVFFVLNNAFNDFINQYLIFNINYANESSLNIWQLIKYNNFGNRCFTLLILIINILLIMRSISKKDIKSIRNLCFSLLFIVISILVVIMPGKLYEHYAIILIPSYIIPISYLLKMLVRIKLKTMIMFYIKIFIIALITEFSLSNNVADVKWPDATYITSEYINSITEKDDDVLVIGNQCIIYLLSDRKTDCKYIYQFPPVTIDDNIKVEITDYINEKLPDIIIYIDDFESYFKNMLENLLKDGKYKLDDTHGYPILIKMEGEYV